MEIYYESDRLKQSSFAANRCQSKSSLEQMYVIVLANTYLAFPRITILQDN